MAKQVENNRRKPIYDTAHPRGSNYVQNQAAFLIIKSYWFKFSFHSPLERHYLSACAYCAVRVGYAVHGQQPASLVPRPFSYAHAREGKQGSGIPGTSHGPRLEFEKSVRIH